MAEIHKTINGYRIYICGTWCEVTREGDHVFDGNVEEGMSAEEVYRIVRRMEKEKHGKIQHGGV